MCKWDVCSCHERAKRSPLMMFGSCNFHNYRQNGTHSNCGGQCRVYYELGAHSAIERAEMYLFFLSVTLHKGNEVRGTPKVFVDVYKTVQIKAD